MPDEFVIRSFQPADQAACLKLYRGGLLGGTIADNDTGIDIDDIDASYMKDKSSHFWVAVVVDRVVGMIGVQKYEADEGEIRRLRIDPNFLRRGIGTALLKTAINHCHDHGILKVTLDTWIDRELALKAFDEFNFVHQRTRESNGKQLLTFYLDIYGSDREDSQ